WAVIPWVAILWVAILWVAIDWTTIRTWMFYTGGVRFDLVGGFFVAGFKNAGQKGSIVAYVQQDRSIRGDRCPRSPWGVRLLRDDHCVSFADARLGLSMVGVVYGLSVTLVGGIV
ncbi:MAG TPA: hypothetical protein VHB27_16680, partial [Rhodopila sp.]|uniref:hypothetical protein n=1 Tax=Rhodopila sp. TaxID=2480087 RepID=UPI002C70832F